jgi:hypothetical protein
MNAIYGYPDMGRYGLGNMLFPWARCYLWCKDNNIPMLAPTWLKVRIGPYLRGERDKRHYERLFNNRGYVGGVKKWLLLSVSKKISEIEKDQNIIKASQLQTDKVVIFNGWPDLFTPLFKRSIEVKLELERITLPMYMPVIDQKSTSFIGIHIRRGDFSKPKQECMIREGTLNVQVPITWFIQVLTTLRTQLGFTAKAILFSDGTEDDIKEIIKLPDVDYQKGGKAITDLLMLAQSRCIIASGSTFSMWSSYLGQVPSIWHPGQRRQRILDENRFDLEPEYEMNTKFSNEFIDTVSREWMHR